MARVLDESQLEQWRSTGAVWPVDLLTSGEAAGLRARYEALDESTEGGAQSRYRIKAHLPFPWLWDVIRRPRLIDAIGDLLGPDFVCWGSSFFAKKAHDPSFISWHQDSTYYGARPPGIGDRLDRLHRRDQRGGLHEDRRGSHLGPEILVHDEIPDPDNMLVRGQTVRDVDESLAVEMPLAAGQMSIHHNKTIHSSEPNRADWPRIGFAVHFGGEPCAPGAVRRRHRDPAEGRRSRGKLAARPRARGRFRPGLPCRPRRGLDPLSDRDAGAALAAIEGPATPRGGRLKNRASGSKEVGEDRVA